MALSTEKKTEKHNYYYIIDEVQYGPVELFELLPKVDRNTMVWREGIEWAKASEVPELRNFFPEPSVIVVNNSPASGASASTYGNTIASMSNAPGGMRQRVNYDGIYCSSDEKMILGFCSGLAHKFNVNIGVMRIIAFFSVGYCYLYLVGIFLPKHPTKNLN